MVRVSVRRMTDKVSVEPEAENFLVSYYNGRIRMSCLGGKYNVRKYQQIHQTHIQRTTKEQNTTTKTNKAKRQDKN